MGLSHPLDYLYNSSTRNLALPLRKDGGQRGVGVRWLTSQPIPALVVHLSLPRTTRARHSLAMLRTVLMLAFFVSSCSSLHTPAVASRSRPVVMMPGPGKAWETANVPRGRVVMNPFENLKQMQDQRVAGLSHVNPAPGKCTLPLQEAIALMKQWKEEIGDDAEKFAERVSRSRCEAAA